MFGNNGNDHHHMWLEKTYPTNAQEWVCSVCDRRLMVQWEPRFKIVVLEAGEEHVSHSGSNGGMQMDTPYLDEPVNDEMPEDLREALEDWLSSKDFDD